MTFMKTRMKRRQVFPHLGYFTALGEEGRSYRLLLMWWQLPCRCYNVNVLWQMCTVAVTCVGTPCHLVIRGDTDKRHQSHVLADCRSYCLQAVRMKKSDYGNSDWKLDITGPSVPTRCEPQPRNQKDSLALWYSASLRISHGITRELHILCPVKKISFIKE